MNNHEIIKTRNQALEKILSLTFILDDATNKINLTNNLINEPDTWLKVHEDFIKELPHHHSNVPIISENDTFYAGFKLNQITEKSLQNITKDIQRIDYLINRSVDSDIHESPNLERYDIEFIAKKRDLQFETAKQFHSKYSYPGKIPNITQGGTSSPLNKVLFKEYGFMLTELELKKLHTELKESKSLKTEEVFYIDFLNKDKKFQLDRVTFKGKDAYEDAKKWGKDNLDNFHGDMINSKQVIISKGKGMKI